MSLVKEKTPALRTTQFRIQLFNPGKYKTIYKKTKKLTPDPSTRSWAVGGVLRNPTYRFWRAGFCYPGTVRGHLVC